MARLPVSGSDDGTWGDILNAFLSVEHDGNGMLKPGGSLSTKANDSAVVHNTGAETVAGTKTFSASPVVPAPSLGSHASTKTYVDNAAAKISGTVVYVEDYGAVGDGATDDSAAIKNAIAAAVSAAQSDGSYYAEVRFKAKTYMVNTPTTGGATNGSAMVPLPVLPVAGQKMTLVLKGVGDASGLYHWNQTTVQKAGTTLRTTHNAGDSLPATGEIAVVGGPTPHYGYGYPSGLFSNMLVVVDGVLVVVPENPRICGFDFRGVAEMHVITAAVLAASTSAAPEIPDPVWGWALSPPDIQNNALCDIDSFSVEGHVTGLRITEHVRCNSLRAIGCFNGIACDGSSGFPHANWIGYACVENCKRSVAFATSRAKLNIECLDIESPTASTGDHQINDPGNAGEGTIRMFSNAFDPNDLNANVLNDSTLGVNGASGLRVINSEMYPGNTTAPSVPATTVALRNPFWRDAAVSVTGTVTGVKIDGVATGATGAIAGATFFVPTGKTIELDYAGGAPTWVWTIL
ncbi:MAG TPA: glycosyl hydrolase family 28-related protein [Candidatus Saccharimonadales bacterium]|nr:glycosyl hydrolase family 28-related protein [Candidatus Saccharimonadales bacterium]